MSDRKRVLNILLVSDATDPKQGPAYLKICGRTAMAHLLDTLKSLKREQTGPTITKHLPPGSLAMARNRHTNKPGWNPGGGEQ